MAKIVNNFNSLDYVQGTLTGVTLMDAMQRVAQYRYSQLGAIYETTIWLRQTTSMQRRINQGKAKEEGEYLISQSPQGGARVGVLIGEALSVEEKSIRCQGIANRDSCAAAWLLANPSLIFIV
jgi:hypothetical protein